jgi:hypothetical protein
MYVDDIAKELGITDSAVRRVQRVQQVQNCKKKYVRSGNYAKKPQVEEGFYDPDQKMYI